MFSFERKSRALGRENVYFLRMVSTDPGKLVNALVKDYETSAEETHRDMAEVTLSCQYYGGRENTL